MLEFMQGDMFDVPADVRVNTVNCVGVMGAGAALAFKQRYPEMFKDYQRACQDGRVRPGRMHVWKSLSGDWVINFPTKRDWREPSRYEDIDAGLDDLRSYLSTLGPVTVALPALGCGHGGLDWARVSQAIREKLGGLEARILVFEPSASRRAGRAAATVPTEVERQAAEALGYDLAPREDGGPEAPAYVLGEKAALARRWIALLSSRAPGERELQALRAIAAALGGSAPSVSVAMVHSGRNSEDIADFFVREGIDTVLLMPFGVLTRPALAKRPKLDQRLTLASIAPANAKWSPQHFAQAMDLLRSNAASVLLSDPDPDWLARRGLGKWAQAPLSYVRYETTPAQMRDALAEAGAKAIGRRSDDGTPSLDHLTRHWRDAPARERGHAPEALSAPPSNGGPSRPRRTFERGQVVSVTLSDLSEARKREMFDALVAIEATRVTLELPPSASAAERQRLRDLGFDLHDAPAARPLPES